MKRVKQTLGIATLLLAINSVNAQEKPAEYKVNVYGFARADYIFDSRQNAQAREEQVDLYPLDKALDANGSDKNAAGASNFLAFTSRLGVKASGPNVFGAKTGATVEADFFGNTNGNTSVFTLRHAYATLDWAKTSLLLGQTWYPSFITDCYPGVANFNTGIMFNPFGRAPQVKLTERFTSNFSADLVAYKTSTHSPYSITAAGAANDPSYNSLMPAIHAKLQYKNDHITTGVAAEYQSLKPLLVSAGKTSTNTVNSNMVLAYFKYSNPKIIAKLYGVTGTNMYQFTMMGGYAGYLDSNGQESYKATKTTAAWFDLASNAPKVAPGIFFGYTKNGGVDIGYKTLYARGLSTTRTLDNVWRVSARVDFKENKFKIAPELEYTSATWGDTQNDATTNHANNTTVGNIRAMVSAQYSF